MCFLKDIFKVKTPAKPRNPLLGGEGKDIPSPRVKMGTPYIVGNEVRIPMNKPVLAAIYVTNSMEPLIDVGHWTAQETAFIQDDIRIGSIIVWGGISHPVYLIDTDEEGWFCRTWGYNCVDPDPEKIRFEDIEALVGIIGLSEDYYFRTPDGD